MALYEYSSLAANGKSTTGVIDADTLMSAKAKLHEMRVIVTKISQTKKSHKSLVNKQTLINFTREVMQLLSSGLPLYESLLTIEEKYRNHKAHVIFLDLCDKVKGGIRFSKALSHHPSVFDQLYISMVESGENTGHLEKAFLQLYRVVARSEKFKRQIRAAMLYPLFLASFCGVILIGLFLFLIPSMKELFEGRSLHPMTRFVLAISDAMNAHAYWFFPLFISSVVTLIFLLRRDNVKRWFKRYMNYVPLLKKMVLEAVLCAFFVFYLFCLQVVCQLQRRLGFQRE